MEMFSYNTKIKMRDLDLFQHVNNANYLVLFEEARWALLMRDESLWAESKKSNIGPVILDLDLSFKRELCFNDEIRIDTTFVQIKNKLVVELHQDMYKISDSPKGKEDQISSTLNIRIGLMDLDKRKLVTPPDVWLKILGLTEL